MAERQNPTSRFASEEASPGSLAEPKVHPEAPPRGMFVNLFRVALPPGGLDPIKQATTKKARKTELKGDYRRPFFYESRAYVFAYGPGLDEFDDGRFNRAIIMPNSEPAFSLYLVKWGLIEFFRNAGYPVRPDRQGFFLIDDTEMIAEAGDGAVKLHPDFLFQPYYVEDMNGVPSVAVSIEPGWTTVPGFALGRRLRSHGHLIGGLRVKVTCGECSATCPLHQYSHEGWRFEEFCEETVELDSDCDVRNLNPAPVRIVRGRRDDTVSFVVPGQLVQPMPFQRRVLALFKEQSRLRRSARVWLGDLTASGSVRSGALAMRYDRTQSLLAKVANGGPELRFELPTGQQATLTREPVGAELVANDV